MSQLEVSTPPVPPPAGAKRPRGSRADGPDPLAAFPTEEQVAKKVARRDSLRRLALNPWVLAGVAVVAALGVWLAVAGGPASALGRLGISFPGALATLVVQTAPAGWDVTEGGRRLGTTPLTVRLAPGRHALLLQKGVSSRPLDVTLTAGTEVVHHLDLPAEPVTGALHVDTAPPGAAVYIDGVQRGMSPVDVEGLTTGDHAVALTSGNRVVNERVTIAPGVTATLLVPLPQADASTAVGWVAIAAPIELQVYDGDALVGSSRNQQIMLMPGRRTLRLVNVALGFETTAPVRIDVGAVTKHAVKVPNGTLSVNAVPWAEVVLDGKVIGETPVANYSVPLGSHELLFRNPRFAEQRRTVVISLTSPVRIGVDLRQ